MFSKKENGKIKEAAFSSISAKSFITVVAVLVIILIFCGGLSNFIPQGEFVRDQNGIIITDSFTEGEISGIAPWRVITAPFRVFASEDATTIIVISIFLLVMSGVFNLLEKTNGIKVFISRIMKRLRDKGGPIVCITVFIFMLFGSLFGMFEELVTLLPIIIVFMLSMNMDTMTGLGACLMAACFGFSTAITNPFSVGLAAEYAGVAVTDGVWLRVVFFGIIYGIVCLFLMHHLKKISKNPQLSPTFETDIEKRKTLDLTVGEEISNENRIFKSYAVFFAVQAVLLVLIATVRAISGLAIPILAASFLITGVITGIVVTGKLGRVFSYILKGAAAMLPAVLMIALASSVKLVMTESGIIDTIMYFALNLLIGKSKFLTVVLVYFLILFLQLFIGSASAKIVLVMPIVLPIATALGISPTLVILAYCMADGFTDVIMPTNPVLLIGLSMANVSYTKWVKWTWKIQVLVFIITLLILFFGVVIGY